MKLCINVIIKIVVLFFVYYISDLFNFEFTEFILAVILMFQLDILEKLRYLKWHVRSVPELYILMGNALYVVIVVGGITIFKEKKYEI